MATTRRLTPNAIDALTKGSMKDPERPGLSIEAGKRGKVWRYYRRVAGTKTTIDLKLGIYPAFTIPDARAWADELNASVERGIDPRVSARATKAIAAMTVADAHALYFADVSRTDVKPLKADTLMHKLKIYKTDMARIADKPLLDVTADDLWTLVEDKGETAPVRANRLAAEMKVFFKWCLSRPARKAGIELAIDPATSLNGAHFVETPRTRFLTDDELGWYLAALAQETRMSGSTAYRRGFLLLLLTGCRIGELIAAPASEYRNGVWYRPAERLKNGEDHAIPLGPWGQSLMATNGEWIVSHPDDAEKSISDRTWYWVRDRIHRRMEELADQPIEKWVPHDLRRTMRSNTRRLGIDTETAEDMMAHKRSKLIETYDRYDAIEEMRDAYARWEGKLIEIATKAGLADALGVPVTKAAENPDMPLPLAA